MSGTRVTGAAGATVAQFQYPTSWQDIYGRTQTGIGYKGFDWRPFMFDFTVVPKNTPLNGKLPSFVQWTDKAGAEHQIHLYARDLPKLLDEIRKSGGKFSVISKATPGLRWVPHTQGDY